MSALAAVPIVLPLGAGALSIALWAHPRWQRGLGLATLSALLVATVALLLAVRSHGPLVVAVGGWPAPVGITLVADMLAAILLVVSAVVLLSVLVYAIGHPATDDLARFFHPVYLVLATGIGFAFLAGDLFTLFVAFEVMLSASYVLILLGARPAQVRTGMTYVVISLVASVLFITTVGLIYAATGTVNLADLATRLPLIPAPLRRGLVTLLLVVFGIKAAVFPLFFWLPDAYPTAPTAITAVFAGLLTKVGVYAIIRTQTLLLPVEGPSPLLLWVAGATMVVGVLGALAQDDLKRILSFHIVSQIGYMIMGLGLFTAAGLAAGVFYIVHHIIVKTSLFLVGGLVEHAGRTSALRRLGALAHATPLVALLFAIPALSLAGLPPFSGFVAKLGLVEAGLAIGQPWIVAVSLVVSLLTLLSMAKIWTGAFWGPVGSREVAATHGRPLAMTAGTVALVVVSLAVGFAARPILDVAVVAADQLLDGTYVSVVLP